MNAPTSPALLVNPADQQQGIGASPPRKEDQRFLLGRGQYVGDIRMPDLLDVAFVRSPVAHARLGGCFLSIGDIHTFTEGMTSGAGYLSTAAMIFGNSRVGRMGLACLLFGAAIALQFRLPALGIDVPKALLIMLPYVLALLAVSGLIGRQTAPAYLTQAYRR